MTRAPCGFLQLCPSRESLLQLHAPAPIILLANPTLQFAKEGSSGTLVEIASPSTMGGGGGDVPAQLKLRPNSAAGKRSRAVRLDPRRKRVGGPGRRKTFCKQKRFYPPATRQSLFSNVPRMSPGALRLSPIIASWGRRPVKSFSSPDQPRYGTSPRLPAHDRILKGLAENGAFRRPGWLGGSSSSKQTSGRKRVH